MQYEVEFEANDGDKTKETGIMIDVVQTHDGCYKQSAIIVLGNQKVVTVPLSEIRVVDQAIGAKFLEIEEKHAKLDLHVDIVDA